MPSLQILAIATAMPNVVAVPEGPGLGITLARDALAFCHRHYLEHGPMNKYHDPARPGTYRRLPLN